MTVRLTFAAILAALLLVAVAADSFTDDKGRLQFKVSARDLPDKDPLGTTDPFVLISLTENDDKNEKEVGRSATLTNDENPDWSDVFNIDFDRRKNQRLHFIIRDHDVGQPDDHVAQVWVNVNEYVDKKQYLQVNLIKRGYLIIKRV